MSLLAALHAFMEYSFDDQYVFKKCDRPPSLIVMRKLPESIDTENPEEGKNDGVEPRVIVNARAAQFRADHLFVVAIKTLEDFTEIDRARSLRDSYFEYRVGKVVRSARFEPNKHIVSAEGIHYFKSLIPALCFGLMLKHVDKSHYNGVWYDTNYNGKLLGVYHLEKGEFRGKQQKFNEDGSVVAYEV